MLGVWKGLKDGVLTHADVFYLFDIFGSLRLLINFLKRERYWFEKIDVYEFGLRLHKHDQHTMNPHHVQNPT